MTSRDRLILDVVKTDHTFVITRLPAGEAAWVGKCLHCNRKLVVSLDGQLLSGSLEHIWPRNHGGDDDLHNLALACARCNQSKGTRLDWRPANDPALVRTTQKLQAKRAARWRNPEQSSEE